MEKLWQPSDLKARSVIQQKQLEEWQVIASRWGVYTDVDSVGTPVRCITCHQALYFTTDSAGGSYLYSDDEIMALTVAHIRQNHGEVNRGGL